MLIFPAQWEPNSEAEQICNLLFLGGSTPREKKKKERRKQTKKPPKTTKKANQQTNHTTSLFSLSILIYRNQHKDLPVVSR